MSEEIFGHFHERATQQCEHLTLAFSPLRVPLHSRWRNNGLSADFLGDYVITFLPRGGSSAPTDNVKQAAIRHAVTYIANELLENAMKYHQHRGNDPITLYLELARDYIAVSANNGVDREQAGRYRHFVGQLLQEDANEMLIRQLEANALQEDSATSSCLGLLTMITDYGAQLGWQFETAPEPSDSISVTTTAVLPLSNLPEGVSE